MGRSLYLNASGGAGEQGPSATADPCPLTVLSLLLWLLCSVTELYEFDELQVSRQHSRRALEHGISLLWSASRFIAFGNVQRRLNLTESAPGQPKGARRIPRNVMPTQCRAGCTVHSGLLWVLDTIHTEINSRQRAGGTLSMMFLSSQRHSFRLPPRSAPSSWHDVGLH